jgi:DNA-directed RNA polymerase specialized sigma24 family protein
MNMRKSASFPTTPTWSRVIHCGDPGSPKARAAFSELCELYWYPVYCFLRRDGAPADQAEDLAQAFFAYAFEKSTFSKADRERRFRSFVIACLKNFRSDARDRDNAAKRGGGFKIVHFEGLEGEARYKAERHDLTPERLCERTLALELLTNAMTELEHELRLEDGLRVDAEKRKLPIFEALRDYVLGDERPVESYAEVSVNLEVNVRTLRSHVSRFRKRLRELIRVRVGNMVASESDVDSEMLAMEDAI